MCRYSITEYKNHFVCFDCRKGFKKTAIADFLKQHDLDYVYKEFRKTPKGAMHTALEQKYGTTYKNLLDFYYENIAACPECGEKMWSMGLDFRVPPQSDKKQWVVIEFLARHNFAFYGCGCQVGITPPTNPSELPQWLKEHTKETKGQKLLQQFLKRA